MKTVDTQVHTNKNGGYPGPQQCVQLAHVQVHNNVYN